jgi:hypothetical protein
MSIPYSTPVPNNLFDRWVQSLSPTELKTLLIIIRQTLGWVNPLNRRKRKTIDRLTVGFLCNKTGCSRRAVSTAIDTLSNKSLIKVYDKDKNHLQSPESRKGKSYLYFEICEMAVENNNQSQNPRQKYHMIRAKIAHQPEQTFPTTKAIHINQIIKRNYSFFKPKNP